MSFAQLGWFPLSIIFVLFISVSKVLLKVSLNGENTHPIALSIYVQLLVSVMILFNMFSNIGPIPKQTGIWLLVLLVSAIYAGANIFYFYALKDIEVSQVDILSSSKAVWFLVGGLIIFGEVITLYKVLGVLLIIAGLAIIYWKKRSFDGFGKHQVYVLICAAMYGFAAIIDKYLVNHFASTTYIFLDFFIPTVITALIIPSAVPKVLPLIRLSKVNLAVILSALLNTIGTFALFSAYKSGGEISKVGPIALSSVVVTVMLGIVFLKERDKLWRKMIGSVIVFGGVYLIQAIK